MTSLLRAGEAAEVRSIARIDLPASLLAEINPREVGRELEAAVNNSKESQRRLAEAQSAKWWQLWRWGDRDKAVEGVLQSIQEYQRVNTKISAYNIWLSQKVLETEEVLKKQNDRIEAAQSDIKGKMAEADATLSRFKADVVRVRDDLVEYLNQAIEEKQSLAASAEKTEKLLREYEEHAEVIQAQIESTLTLAARTEQVEQWAKDFAPNTQSKLTCLEAAISESSDSLHDRLSMVQSETSDDVQHRFQTLAWAMGLSTLVLFLLFIAVWLKISGAL